VNRSSVVSVPTPQRTWFCILVAVVAAALADPLVEFASNAGAFGRCNCTDHSNLDVFPALFVGLVLGIALLSLRIRKLLVASFGRTPAPAAVLAPRPLMRIVPVVFAIQLAVLFAMETTEQFIVRGHGLGGTIWLGAPVPISLAIHATFAIIATFAISRLLCTITQASVRIVIFLRAIVLSARGQLRTLAPLRYPMAFRRTTPLVCRNGMRAPPLLTD
jgi:hypothetical protein